MIRSSLWSSATMTDYYCRVAIPWIKEYSFGILPTVSLWDQWSNSQIPPALLSGAVSPKISRAGTPPSISLPLRETNRSVSGNLMLRWEPSNMKWSTLVTWSGNIYAWNSPKTARTIWFSVQLPVIFAFSKWRISNPTIVLLGSSPNMSQLLLLEYYQSGSSMLRHLWLGLVTEPVDYTASIQRIKCYKSPKMSLEEESIRLACILAERSRYVQQIKVSFTEWTTEPSRDFSIVKITQVQ